MRFYFAYGSNMIASDMRRRCPTARFRGVARLRHHCFRIVRSGFASLAPEHGAVAYGVLWSITAGDWRRLDAYEEIARGLYRQAYFPVEAFDGGERVSALVYLARDASIGRPRRAYLEPILAAAQAHEFPAAALADIARWLPRTSASGPAADK